MVPSFAAAADARVVIGRGSPADTAHDADLLHAWDRLPPCAGLPVPPAWNKAPSAARDKELPTLTRRTPIPQTIARLHRPPSPITTLTGQSTDFTTVAISSLPVRPCA